MQNSSSRASKQSSEIPINLPSQNTTFDHVAGECKKMITFLLTWTKYDRGSGCETFWFNVGGQKKLGCRKNLEALDPQEQA